jgi:hypothetical protein
MKRSIVGISLLTASLLSAAPFFSNEREVLKEHPLKVENRSIDYGGTLPTIDAYRDGVGVMAGTFEGDNAVDNTPLNTLVYKYGEDAKNSDSSIKNYVELSGSGKEEDILLANKIEPVEQQPSFESASSPGSLTLVGYYPGALPEGGSIAIAQVYSSTLSGSMATLNTNSNLYMEFVQGGNYLTVGINAINTYLNAAQFNTYNNPSSIISIYYNSLTNKASLCVNGASCQVWDSVPNNDLTLHLGSGTRTARAIHYVDPEYHNLAYKESSFNATLN